MNFLVNIILFIQNIKNSFLPNDSWVKSEFFWIAALPSARKGKLGRLVAQKILTDCYGNIVTRAGLDLIVAGKKKTYTLSVKCSLLWESGVYTFEQIKEGYDGYCFLGISPNKKMHFWVLPPTEYKNFHSQHNKYSCWVSIQPTNPSWSRYGGELSSLTPKSFFLDP